jgi:type VI secretion system protein ImpB
MNTMAESTQHKLDRVRKPRVHITYDVETEGAAVRKELPFVVGVLGDFSGNPTEPLKPMSDRKFIEVDRDNFDEVMARMTPGLELRVENTIQGDGSEMAVNLRFDRMDDFDPGNVAKQVEPLKKLLDARDRLKELQSAVDRSEDFENRLEDILKKTENLDKLAGELGVSSEDDEGDKE